VCIFGRFGCFKAFLNVIEGFLSVASASAVSREFAYHLLRIVGDGNCLFFPAPPDWRPPTGDSIYIVDCYRGSLPRECAATKDRARSRAKGRRVRRQLRGVRRLSQPSYIHFLQSRRALPDSIVLRGEMGTSRIGRSGGGTIAKCPAIHKRAEIRHRRTAAEESVEVDHRFLRNIDRSTARLICHLRHAAQTCFIRPLRRRVEEHDQTLRPRARICGFLGSPI